MRTHDGKQECTVRRQHCRRAEAIPYAGSRPAPMTPGGKARIVGFQILTAEHALLDDLMVHQQDATVPQFRLLAFQRFEIIVDLGTMFCGEDPGPWRK